MCVVFEAMVVKNVELFPLNARGNFFILRFPFLIFPVGNHQAYYLNNSQEPSKFRRLGCQQAQELIQECSEQK